MQTATIPTSADLAAELAAMNDTEAAAEARPEPVAAAAPEAEGEPPSDAPADDAEVKDEPLDPAAQKRLEAEQKKEERWRRQMAEERKAIAAEQKKARDEIAAEREALKGGDDDRKALADLKALRERAKNGDPDAAAELLHGVDFDVLTRLAYSQTAEGQKDPKAKEYAARLLRERAARGEVGGVKNEVGDLRDQISKLKEQVEQTARGQADQAVMNEYLDTVEDSVTDADHPVLTKALTAAKAKASDRAVPVAERREAQAAVKAIRNECLAVASEMYRRDGVEPDPAEVAAEVESRRVAQIKAWGFDPSALGVPAKKGAPAGTSRTLTRAGAGATTTKPKLEGQALLDDIKAKVEAGKLDDV